MADLTPGGTLAAVEALADRQAFTREQVAYLMHLAYESGRTAAYRDDLVDLHAGWARSRWRRRHADLVAERVAEYTAAADRINARLGRPAGYRYDGGPVDWDTGRPADWDLAELVDQEAGGAPRWPGPRTRWRAA